MFILYLKLIIILCTIVRKIEICCNIPCIKKQVASKCFYALNSENKTNLVNVIILSLLYFLYEFINSLYGVLFSFLAFLTNFAFLYFFLPTVSWDEIFNGVYLHAK